MSREPSELPPEFAEGAFSISSGRRAGLSETRMRARDLDTPFAGVRSANPPALDALALARHYRPKIADGQFFSHSTAAALHGMWLPLDVERDLRVHVSVHKPQRAPRGRRVCGHHLIPRPGLLDRWDGLPVADPVETWCQLATLLDAHGLVIAGDSLVARGRPDAAETLAMIRAAADDRHRPRFDRLRAAAPRIRAGSRSPWESRTRLVLVDGGLPEPAMNVVAIDETGWIVAEGDLVYPEARVWIEYEGDQHRTDRAQFRSDLVRYERLQDLAWRVVRVTSDDVTRRRSELVERVRRLLVQRGD